MAGILDAPKFGKPLRSWNLRSNQIRPKDVRQDSEYDDRSVDAFYLQDVFLYGNATASGDWGYKNNSGGGETSIES